MMAGKVVQNVRAQQEVKAPGSVPPGARSPLHICNVVAAHFAKPPGFPLTRSKFNLYDPVGPTVARFGSNLAQLGELNADTCPIGR